MLSCKLLKGLYIFPLLCKGKTCCLVWILSVDVQYDLVCCNSLHLSKVAMVLWIVCCCRVARGQDNREGVNWWGEVPLKAHWPLQHANLPNAPDKWNLSFPQFSYEEGSVAAHYSLVLQMQCTPPPPPPPCVVNIQMVWNLFFMVTTDF